jgi:pyruvate kinase
MNRREAIIAALGFAGVSSIARIEPKANEVLVLETEGLISSDMGQRLKNQLQEVFPGQRVVILDGGMKLKVAKVD